MYGSLCSCGIRRLPGELSRAEMRLNMQVGIRLHDVEGNTLEEKLKAAQEKGFSCVHLASKLLVSQYGIDAGALTPGFAMYIKRLLNQYQLDQAVYGCYLNLANPDPEQLKKITETYKASIRFAAVSGAGVVGTETGAPNTEYRTVPECWTEDALKILIENLRPVVEYAEKLGVIFAIEPVWGHIVHTVEKARRVLDEIGSPNLQIIFDPVNLLGMDNYQKQDEMIRKAFELLGDDIAVIHAKDFVVEKDRLRSVASGTGALNYPLLMRYIKEKKPFIHVTMEDTLPENSLLAKEFMERVWKEA